MVSGVATGVGVGVGAHAVLADLEIADGERGKTAALGGHCGFHLGGFTGIHAGALDLNLHVSQGLLSRGYADGKILVVQHRDFRALVRVRQGAGDRGQTGQAGHQRPVRRDAPGIIETVAGDEDQQLINTSKTNPNSAETYTDPLGEINKTDSKDQIANNTDPSGFIATTVAASASAGILYAILKKKKENEEDN